MPIPPKKHKLPSLEDLEEDVVGEELDIYSLPNLAEEELEETEYTELSDDDFTNGVEKYTKDVYGTDSEEYELTDKDFEDTGYLEEKEEEDYYDGDYLDETPQEPLPPSRDIIEEPKEEKPQKNKKQIALTKTQLICIAGGVVGIILIGILIFLGLSFFKSYQEKKDNTSTQQTEVVKEKKVKKGKDNIEVMLDEEENPYVLFTSGIDGSARVQILYKKENKVLVLCESIERDFEQGIEQKVELECTDDLDEKIIKKKPKEKIVLR